MALFLLPIKLEADWSKEAGSFPIQAYSPRVYGASPQNWAITEDHRGILYVGNTDCVLEYDGVTWRKIPVANGSSVRSLQVDASGTVFVGAQGDFGYLRPDRSGALQYTSLLNHVPAADRKFADVWSVLPTSEGVYFATYRRLFRWSQQSGMKVWRPKSSFGHATLVDGVPCIFISGSGQYCMVNEQLELVPGTEKFAKTDIRSVIRDGGQLLVVTPTGLYRRSGQSFDNFPTEAEVPLRENGIYSCLRLTGRGLACATSRGGLFLLDSGGTLNRVIGKRDGLGSDTVNALFVDRRGGLWLALGSGIARLDLALSRFDESLGLRGNVYAITRHAGVLYAGTNIGLFRMQMKPARAPEMEPVGGVQETVIALASTSHGLLAGGQRGVYEITEAGAAAKVLSTDVVYDLSVSPKNPDVLYAAGRAGVFLLRRTAANWTKVKEVPATGEEFRSVLEDVDGRVWVTTRGDIDRIDFNTDPPELERFGTTQGVPIGWKNVYRVNGRVYFATPKGLMRLASGDKRFVPDSSLGTIFADGSRPVSLLREDVAGDIWTSGEGYHGRLRREGAGRYRWQPNLMVIGGIQELYSLHPDGENVAWASGQEGPLVRYEISAQRQDELQTILRAVHTTSDGQTMYQGSGQLAAPAQLGYRQNALRFEFAAPFFGNEAAIEYEVRLDGSDHEWSRWTAETRKDYTNLSEGAYTFRVRARNPDGYVSREARLSFRILAPWYRTWWAYTLYALVAGLALWGVLRWRLRQLEAANRKLEVIVEQRTVEIRRQRDQLRDEEKKTEALLLNILPELVAKELRSTGSVAPMSFEDVTVCFTDFVGFTLSSEKLAPQRLVAALDQYFTAFDRIVTRYGLEKLKTIGDSYMFVSGMPQRRAAHAVDAVMAALEMVRAVEELSAANADLGWKVRLGLHSGPVVAGVVGERKFAFDIWSTTVNFASRMESSGLGNRVNVSERTYALIQDVIDCQPRGKVSTKEGREFEMYLACGRRPELRDNAAFASRYQELFSETPVALTAES